MENLHPSPESSPKLKPLESPASSGWTYNQIGGCPSVLHHALHIHGNPRLSHDHLRSFKHFLKEEGVLILTSWPKCNMDNYTVLCNILSGVRWCFPVLPIMVMWWSNTEMATLPEETPLCQALQCYCQTSHASIFPAVGVQPQRASHSRLLPLPVQEVLTKNLPTHSWAVLSFPFFHSSEEIQHTSGVDSTPALNAHLGQPSQM